MLPTQMTDSAGPDLRQFAVVGQVRIDTAASHVLGQRMAIYVRINCSLKNHQPDIVP